MCWVLVERVLCWFGRRNGDKICKRFIGVVWYVVLEIVGDGLMLYIVPKFSKCVIYE